jgi:hypothetical protein
MGSGYYRVFKYTFFVSKVDKCQDIGEDVDDEMDNDTDICHRNLLDFHVV